MSAVRPLSLTPELRQNEEFLMAYAIIWFSLRMVPKRRYAATAGHTRPTRALPSSALQAVYAWRRVLGDVGCELPGMKGALRQLKGLSAAFVSDFGQNSLTQRKQQPLPRSVLLDTVARLDA
eukprot:3651749-Pleurochrysis_carterae.AAC.1